MIPRDKRLAIAKELQKWFHGRTDVVGVSNDHGFAPEQLDEPLSAERVANEHLAGKHCFAIYLLRTDGNIWFSCLDFDDKQRRPDATIRAKVDSVVACLQQVGIKPLVELSQSGRGVHVWVFFRSAKPAWQVRAFWRGVLEHLKLPLATEIYPRQNSLEGKSVGNPIRLPLWNQSRFVDPGREWKLLQPLAALTGIAPVTSKALQHAATQLGIDISKPIQPTVSKGRVLPAGHLSPRVTQLLTDTTSLLARRWRGETEGMADKSRSAIVASIAIQLVYRYVPTPEIENAIRFWCAEQGYDKGSRTDWVDLVVANAYELAARQDSFRRAGVTAAVRESLSYTGRREINRRVQERVKNQPLRRNAI